ncbi:Cytochrome P450 714B3 [Vitis vinifera]|uniref:Cytochrome P450 714B3 n=1 Tax=Vitis vinifera TaxID=29760 RepID=A0A438DGT6_VITVI|nr:Cytochrome P450 714B3 [Vitis vinifera]
MHRLYPGVAFVSRQALKDVQLGDSLVPKGVNTWIWMPTVSKAYIPFGVGQRICPGQSLAIAEMKIMYALILSNFSLSLSPNHRHPPRLNLQLEPENGVDLIIPSEDMREPKLLVHCA